MNLTIGNPSTGAQAGVLRLAPLAVPLHIDAADARAAEAVAVACRGWRGEPGPGPTLHLRIALSPKLAGTGRTAIQVDGAVLEISGPGVTARADFARGRAQCEIADDYLCDLRALFDEVLEPLVLIMLTHRDRTPLHAAAFIVDGLAVLLAGRTGAGKSCLARAADEAGHQVLSDDTVFVQLAPRLTVWGWPTAAHLLARDAPAAGGPTRLRNGTVKQVVPLRSASRAAIACNRAVLCLLARSRDGEPTLGPAAESAIKARLWPLDEGFDLLPDPIARALARLAAGGVWELALADDPAAAVRLVVASLPRLSDTCAR